MLCQRCGYEWEARVAKPKCCPECKSRKWREGVVVADEPVVIAEDADLIPIPPQTRQPEIVQPKSLLRDMGTMNPVMKKFLEQASKKGGK